MHVNLKLLYYCIIYYLLTNMHSIFFPTQDQPETIFCDNVNQQGDYFRGIFSPWFSAPAAVQDDALHIIQRYGRVVPDNHPLKSAFYSYVSLA